jgi:hypothetical protein
MSNYYEEQIKKDPWLWEMYKKLPPRKPRPKTAVVTELEGKIAEAARANPESVQVRVTARDPVEKVVVVDRPRRGTVVNVTAVDGNGRPKAGIAYDRGTWQSGGVEFKDGYAQKACAQHEYNPLDAPKGD